MYILIFSGSAGKESACSVGNLGLIPGLRRALGEGKGYPLQYSGLENSVSCIVLGVAKSQRQLRDFHCNWADISLFIKIGTIIVNTFLPMRNKFAYSCGIKICAPRFDKLLESIFCLLLVVEVHSL